MPLQSSTDKDKFTDNVVIMPVNIDELSELISRPCGYENFIQAVHELFDVDKANFDMGWREKAMVGFIDSD